MADTRIVYGASCTWWDSIDRVALTPPQGQFGNRLPCCPNCSGVLFEVENEEKWWSGARKFEADGHPGYVKMIEWARGRCFASMAYLKEVYAVRGETEEADG